MTHSNLVQLRRRMNLQKPEPAPPPADTSGLGVAIQQLIDQAVRQQVKEQVAEAAKHVAPANPTVPQHLRDFTNKQEQHEFPPPAPTAKPPMPVITITRDAAGLIRQAHVGRLTFTVERDGAGKAMRLVPED